MNPCPCGYYGDEKKSNCLKDEGLKDETLNRVQGDDKR